METSGANHIRRKPTQIAACLESILALAAAAFRQAIRRSSASKSTITASMAAIVCRIALSLLAFPY
jgi:hypothetical protein